MATKTTARKQTPAQIAKAEKAAAFRTALLDQLDAYEDDEEAQDAVRIAHFANKYSERNAMLIVMQSPEATEIRTYKGWLAEGRQVRKGEHALYILAPAGQTDDVEAQPATDAQPATESQKGRKFFRLVPMFDIAQTDKM